MKKIVAKIKTLSKFNRQRLDNALMRIQTRPYLNFVLNCVLLSVNGLFRLKGFLLNILSRLGISKSTRYKWQDAAESDPPLAGPVSVPVRLKVLLVVEESIPQCLRYRVEQKIEQLEEQGIGAHYISWKDEQNARMQIHNCHVVIFYRVPGFPGVLNIIESAKALKKIVIYDIDDLIFDRNKLEEKFSGQEKLLSEHERRELFVGADLYRQALEKCNYALASTPSLANEMKRVLPKEKVFVHRNGLDETVSRYLTFKLRKLPRNFTSIFYGSGTKTHDADFRVVSSVLAKILSEKPDVRLTIVGYLSLPEELFEYASQIDQIHFLDLESYLEVLSQADINIAPLEKGIFADCKSEIKWLEAAVLGVPSVVTATQTYQECLKNGVNGMLADTAEEWYEALNLLLGDRRLREVIGKNAMDVVNKEYSVSNQGYNLNRILKECLKMEECDGGVLLHQNKKKLLFVNVLYPPQAIGGATVVCESIVRTVQSAFGTDYNVCVFTYDLNPNAPYNLREYMQDGVHVMALGMPVSPDMDWNYKDERVLQIFSEYLDTVQPDLIHFHSVQRITGSVVEAARLANIPYVVTVHDAWWLSDRQFLIGEDGSLCQFQQDDPLVAMQNSDDINRSINRRRYLSRQLEGAEKIYAVSNFQADLYRQNGYSQILVNRNGLNLNISAVEKNKEKTNILKIGYAGGVCVHKGFYFLRDTVKKCNLPNSHLLIVDFSMSEGEKREANWDGTSVEFIPKFPPEKMAEFYAEIDVLVAPSIWPESFGLITREAIFHGVWTVASEAGALAEDVVPGVNGDRFSAGSSDELVAILTRLDQNREQLVLERTGRATSVRSVRDQVDELVVDYNTILSGNGVKCSRLIQTSQG